MVTESAAAGGTPGSSLSTRILVAGDALLVLEGEAGESAAVPADPTRLGRVVRTRLARDGAARIAAADLAFTAKEA
jgi:hypothetical protein